MWAKSFVAQWISFLRLQLVKFLMATPVVLGAVGHFFSVARVSMDKLNPWRVGSATALTAAVANLVCAIAVYKFSAATVNFVS